MKQITSFLLFVMMVLLPFACQVDDYGRGDNGDSQNGFTLKYQVSGAVAAVTKASLPAEQGENNLESLYLLFFENTSNASGQFLHAVDLSQEGQSLGSIGTIPLDFAPETGISKNENYVLLFLGNTEGYISENSFDELVGNLQGLTENEVIQLYTYSLIGGISDQEDYTSTVVDQEALPMSARAVKVQGEDVVNVELVRNVARFDIKNTSNDYTLVSASLWNAYPETSIWESSFFEYSDTPIKRLYGVKANSSTNRITGGLYGFENYVVAPEQNDTKTTCLIVGLRNNGDGNIYYYRINVNSSYLGQQLKRNNVYTTTIQQVLAKGANTEEDAWSDADFLLDVDINGWDIDDNGSIKYDGENILAVPVTKVIFTHERETREYSIFTLGTGTLEISKESLFPGLSVSLVDNLLTVSVSDSDVDQTGYVELRFGNLKTTVTITQAGFTAEKLELSVDHIPAYGPTASQGYNQVRVLSTGRWNAKIYNSTGDEAFSFDLGTSLVTKSGDSGEDFTIFAIENNPSPSARYAFVLVSLEENPDISRVLVLTQRGIGGIELSVNNQILANDYLKFNPLGVAVNNSPENYYDISVKASSGDENDPLLPWEVSIVNGIENFDCETSVENSSLDNKTIRVIAKNNIKASALSTTFRVRIPSTGAVKDFVVTQDVHTISIDPNTFAVISKQGGSTPEITVTSTSSWTGNITSTGNDAYFDETAGLYMINKTSGDKFKVTFPQLTKPSGTPEATIILTVTGTEVTRTFKVTQQSLTATDFTFASYYEGQPSIASSNAYVNVIRNYMSDTRKFGPSGTVYKPNGYSFSTSNRDVNATSTVSVLQITNNTMSAARRNNITAWWSANQNVLIYAANAPVTNAREVLTNKGFAMVNRTGTANTAQNVRRSFHDESNKITQYMLNGPFSDSNSPLNASDVNLVLGSNDPAYVLTSWPSTFQPILMHPSGGCSVGIDPVLRLVFIGEVSLFSNTRSSANWSGSNAAANEIFLSNLIAWWTNAGLYGSDFMESFR